MADGRKVGIHAAIAAAVIAVIAALCCAFFPALVAGGVLGFASGRWWLGILVFALAVVGYRLWSGGTR